MSDPCFLGLDIGTSAVKAILVASDGALHGSAAAPLELATPEPGWAEQHPDDWWAATVAAVRLLREASPGAEIAAIGLSGQMHSAVLLDRAGAPVRPDLLWCDGRTADECPDITPASGRHGR